MKANPPKHTEWKIVYVLFDDPNPEPHFTSAETGRIPEDLKYILCVAWVCFNRKKGKAPPTIEYHYNPTYYLKDDFRSGIKWRHYVTYNVLGRAKKNEKIEHFKYEKEALKRIDEIMHQHAYDGEIRKEPEVIRSVER
jgi:hypothetical protein